MPTASVVESQRQPHKVDRWRGMMVLGRADSGQQAQPICTQTGSGGSNVVYNLKTLSFLYCSVMTVKALFSTCSCDV